MTPEGFFMIITKLLKSIYISFLLLYILSPLGIIPNAFFRFIDMIKNYIGFVDDIFVLAIILLHISNIYYHHLNNNET
jgi:uncharacterized membrane protein YkvA (DUF1232 family)